MTKLSFYLSTLCLIFFLACSSESTSTDSSTNTKPVAETTDHSITTSASTDEAEEVSSTESSADDKTVISWVENLNIREEPNRKGKVVASAKENEALMLTGKKSDFTETIELRGKSYTEPWVEVKTADGKTGWVFQGAIKKMGEDKGNALNTDTKFTYPHFGTYDLSEWKKLGSEDHSGGDADIEATLYQKGSQYLEIEIADVGEYGWSKTFKLMDANKKVMKERSMSFSSMINEAGDGYEHSMTETVKDFIASPAKQYLRSNKMEDSWFQNKPDMAKGDWKESTIKGASTSSTSDAKLDPVYDNTEIGSFGFGDCTKQVAKDFDCSCSYSTGDRYKGPLTFLSNMGSSACVKINGELNALYEDYESRDYKAELKKLADAKHWITLQKSGPMLYFGKKLEEHKYSNEMDLITDVLLASGKKSIEDVTILNNSEGMAIREVRDMVADAIADANSIRKKGGNDPLSIIKYDNRRYDVFVRTRRMTQYEGEADHYDGKITILPHRGQKVLRVKEIKGSCGC